LRAGSAARRRSRTVDLTPGLLNRPSNRKPGLRSSAPGCAAGGTSWGVTLPLEPSEGERPPANLGRDPINTVVDGSRPLCSHPSSNTRPLRSADSWAHPSPLLFPFNRGPKSCQLSRDRFLLTGINRKPGHPTRSSGEDEPHQIRSASRVLLGRRTARGLAQHLLSTPQMLHVYTQILRNSLRLALSEPGARPLRVWSFGQGRSQPGNHRQ
jgi:hypothetical protein